MSVTPAANASSTMAALFCLAAATSTMLAGSRPTRAAAVAMRARIACTLVATSVNALLRWYRHEGVTREQCADLIERQPDDVTVGAVDAGNERRRAALVRVRSRLVHRFARRHICIAFTRAAHPHFDVGR